MSASTAVYVCLRGDALRVGRLAAARKGVRRWRSAAGLELLPADAVQLPLMSRSAQDAEAVVARLDQLVSIEQLRGAITEEQVPIGCTAVAQRVLSA